MLNQNKQLSVPLSAGITAAWLLVVFLVQRHHELWLDEAHCWLLAKDSNSLSEFFVNIRYEGHPPLWGLLLFFISRFSSSYEAMQLLHLCFAGGSVFLILRYAPFPLWVKVLLPFTYFFGFEYAVISRNYAGAVFFVLLACTQLSGAKRNYTRIALFLGVAALFHVYAGIIGAALLLLYCALSEKSNGASLRTLIAPWILLALFCGVALCFAKAPADHFFYSLHGEGRLSLNKMGTVLGLTFTSLLHFPDLASGNWWNTNLLFPEHKIAAGLVVLAFACIPLLILRSNKRILLLYITGLALLSGAMLLTPMPLSVRHAGFVGLLFFMCLWLMRAGSASPFTHTQRWMLSAILFVQIAAFVVTSLYEVQRDFSASKSAAAWIEEHYPDAEVAVYPHYSGPALSCYLGERVFYAERKSKGSFALWKAERFQITEEELREELFGFMAQHNLPTMLLVVSNDSDLNPDPPMQARRLIEFTDAAVRAERYIIYELKR
jgi:hypothetical protein